ncbi:MAG: hypothetical protein H7066_20970 [Cytophagaceae bacterium]|nr:hypothetical protein [Gemmatimonadaceae bacterium]
MRTLSFVAGLLATSACGSSESLTETPPLPNRQSPPARSAHAMVHDEARGVTLLFGGSGTTTFGDTWTWNGPAWTRVATTGPSPRNIPTLAYDARRQRVVLFGGQSGQTLFTDTWEWDGTTWTQRATTGPEPRIHQVGAYDRRRERVVVFGGAAANDATLFDTWEWDGTAWVRAAIAGPDRFTNGMVFDRARNELLLHVLERTRQANGTYRSELYAWSGTAWALSGGAASGPAFSPTQGVVSLGAAGGILLFDGGTLQGTASTWRWSSSAWAQVPGATPGLRSGHAMAFDLARQRAVLFGGFANQVDFADTWEWNGTSWAEVNRP